MTSPAVSSIELTDEQLEGTRTALRDRITEGLSSDDREIRAFPAFVSTPSRLSGEALVIDTGGTNMRAAVVALSPGRPPEIVSGPVQDKLPVRSGQPLDGDTFFRIQAELAASLKPSPNLPVGYCFSYASRTEPDLDATLMHWTKGIDIPGVEGTRVGKRLHDALKAAGLSPPCVHVVNDTVACLLGGTVVHPGPDPSHVIGLIVGTGTNMAGFFSPKNAPKLAAFGTKSKMAVNLESGNFTPPFPLACDDAIDARSPNDGRQRFEKAVSGYYLPFLLAELAPGLPGFDPNLGSQALVQMRDEAPESVGGQLAGQLLKRSAQMVAAGLAAIMDVYNVEDEVTILAEGSLFWGDPKYAGTVEQSIERCLRSKKMKATMRRAKDVNLVGSAVVALNAGLGGNT